jgi:hypothetical protein
MPPVCSTLVVASLLSVTGPAWGQERVQDSPAVEIRIGAVLASNTGNTFDKRLASLRRPFDSLFPYSSYRLLHEERRRVAWRREAEFRIPGGRYLIVIPREYKDGRVALSMMLIQNSRALVNTALALRDRGTFLVGGPNHRDGVLIIAIGATVQ